MKLNVHDFLSLKLQKGIKSRVCVYVFIYIALLYQKGKHEKIKCTFIHSIKGFFLINIGAEKERLRSFPKRNLLIRSHGSNKK